MPKSKRAKIVHLTKVKKKGRGKGDAFIEEVRDMVDEYSYIYLFSLENQRNAALKNLRILWKNSRFMIGRNKLMAVALGVDENSEFRTGLGELGQRLKGECGLLFTDKETKQVRKYFREFKESQFARSGTTAPRKETLPAGPLDENWPVSMEPQLRKLGLPVRINKGKLFLATETQVCAAGDTLTPEQCKILELFNKKMVSFRVHILGVYNDEKFSDFSQEAEPIKSNSTKTVKTKLNEAKMVVCE
eukprot:CAMPEP_0167754128 /NCGR_PEP_ID=MMETSP0110_2-20121227/8097_1 /TAXON_ID=629695 /ORGANISM="Gymnochlora sp., Strain CCMP2014" /LENGTH=245 /DNA_ID=CAMNT_0007639971 /DNA_START=2133 /DNA_END=2870 /DNA_ORIENTATION=-